MDRGFVQEECMDISYDKKSSEVIGMTNQNYRFIRSLDYNSKLVEMNKPMDSKKIIHSNNLYTFFVKKESILEKKVTQEVIEGYYQTISNPLQKYTKPKAAELYKQVEEQLENIDVEAIEAIEKWIIDWIQNSDTFSEINLTQKNYLKLFFIYGDREKTKRLYEQESRRYLIPNIYNSNDYNRRVSGEILGLPNNNMGMNAKKPYLENKSRKIIEPYLVDMEHVLLQGKFFDYLWGQVSVRKVNIYIDYDRESIKSYDNKEKVDYIDTGCFLRIRKGKNEAEIVDMDTVMGYSPTLKRPFHYHDYYNTEGDWKEEISTGYGLKTSLTDINLMFDEVFFGKQLIYNYFSEPQDMRSLDSRLANIILTYRRRLFDWFYKGVDNQIPEIVEEMALEIVLCSMDRGYMKKVKHQMNLWWSLQDYFAQNDKMKGVVRMVQENMKKHMDMYKEEWNFENDEEYFYTVGQMISYLLTRSKAKNIPSSLANGFLSANKDSVIKEKLIQVYEKYNYDIDLKQNVRVNNLMNHIMLYKPADSIRRDMLVAGITDTIHMYMIKEVNKKGGIEK